MLDLIKRPDKGDFQNITGKSLETR